MTDWQKEFPYDSVCRDDLRSLDVSEKLIEALTDEDMQEIAKIVGQLYCDFGFWDDLRIAFEGVIEKKENDHAARSEKYNQWKWQPPGAD